jgi:hypothetical protein
MIGIKFSKRLILIPDSNKSCITREEATNLYKSSFGCQVPKFEVMIAYLYLNKYISTEELRLLLKNKKGAVVNG